MTRAQNQDHAITQFIAMFSPLAQYMCVYVLEGWGHVFTSKAVVK